MDREFSYMTDAPSNSTFWEDFEVYAKKNGVEVCIKTKPGGRSYKVWPRYFVKEIEKSSKLYPRIAHSGNEYVALYFMKVKLDNSFKFDDFCKVVQPILEDGICIGDPPKSWPSVKIKVPYIDVEGTVEGQSEKIDTVLKAARRLRDFYIQHKQELLDKIPTLA